MQLYSSQQVYQLDQLVMRQDGQSSRQLMFKAASVVWKEVIQRWPEVKRIAVFAGSGNNGGDAFALATQARESGYPVEVFTMGDLNHQSQESCFYRQQWLDSGGHMEAWHGQTLDHELIVDGLLGTGLNKPLDNEWQALIQTINSAPAIRVSIDIPSGLNANTGNAMPCAINANLTMSFIGRKIGCFLADGPDYCGELLYDDLGASVSVFEQIDSICRVLDENLIELPARRRNNSHKNHFGHVLVVGGDRGMSGAVRLAGQAALRSGAGMVSLCVHPDNYAIAAGQHAELMVRTWSEISHQLELSTVIVVGPGLGHSSESGELLALLQKVDKPMVVDADALQAGFIDNLTSSRAVLTPHPGEMARLLDSNAVSIQQDRIKALREANDCWSGVTTVLKGAGTLIGDNSGISLCRHGHAGMATAGMGDVLAGLIGSYMAQGLPPQTAARTAVLLHALAAEMFTLDGDADCLIASDVIRLIPSVVKQVRETLSHA